MGQHRIPKENTMDPAESEFACHSPLVSPLGSAGGLGLRVFQKPANLHD